MEELMTATLAGRKYDDIQEDVVKLVNYYANLWYKNYPTLEKYGYDKEFVVMDVYRGLYLKTKDDGLSNLERHFIKASNIENCTMSYISNLIRKSVRLSLMCISRELNKKPVCDSLDRTVYSKDDKSLSLGDTIKTINEPMEDVVELKLMLESIKHKKYKDYYVVNFAGEKVKLTSKRVLDWIIAGYKVTEMTEKVFYKDGSNIKYKNMSEIKKETIELAREAFKENL